MQLDDFNRPNEGPPPSASWTTPDLRPGLKVLSGVCGHDVEQGGSAIWVAQQFPETQEFELTVATLPPSDQFFSLVVRNSSALAWGTAGNCYYADVAHSAGANAYANMYKVVNGIPTQLGATIDMGAEMAVGWRLKVRAVGNVVTLWRNEVQVASQTDGDVTGPGYVAVRCSEETQRFDLARGGAVGGVASLERIGRGLCRGVGWGMR